MGADNLINFHKWHKWKAISQKCKIVFLIDRVIKENLDSVSFKRLKENEFIVYES